MFGCKLIWYHTNFFASSPTRTQIYAQYRRLSLLEGLFYLNFAFQQVFKPHIAEQKPLIHLYSQLMQKKEFIQGDVKSVYLDALFYVMFQDFV